MLQRITEAQSADTGSPRTTAPLTHIFQPTAATYSVHGSSMCNGKRDIQTIADGVLYSGLLKCLYEFVVVFRVGRAQQTHHT